MHVFHIYSDFVDKACINEKKLREENKYSFKY